MTWHKAKDKRPPCQRCGVKASWNTIWCRPCYAEEQRDRARATREAASCTTCGKPVATSHTEQCLECVKRAVAEKHAGQICADCGTPVSTAKTVRCIACYRANARAEAAKLTCTVCGKKAKSKGLCTNHYRAAYRKQVGRPGGSRIWGAKQAVSLMPCGLCGYDRMRSHVHRLDSPKGYVAGNMVPVCARCHDEIHQGLVAAPGQPPVESRVIHKLVLRQAPLQTH